MVCSAAVFQSGCFLHKDRGSDHQFCHIFSWIQLWTLTEPLENMTKLKFEPCSWMFRMVVLLKGELPPQPLQSTIPILRSAPLSSPVPAQKKLSPQDDTATTVFHSVVRVFRIVCSNDLTQHVAKGVQTGKFNSSQSRAPSSMCFSWLTAAHR